MADFIARLEASSIWTAWLIDWGGRASLLLAVAAAATWCMARRSAAARHTVWLTALVAALGVPLIAATLPVWRVAVPATLAELAFAPVGGGTAAPTSHISPLPPAGEGPGVRGQASLGSTLTPDSGNDEQPPATSLPTQLASSAVGAESAEGGLGSTSRTIPSRPAGAWLPLVWLAGVALLLVRQLAGALRLAKYSRRCSVVQDRRIVSALTSASLELKLRRAVRLLLTEETIVPMTWGLCRPVVLLPKAAQHWSSERLRVVLLHELVHIERRDSWSHWAAQVARAVHWYNPLVWFGVQRLQIERERACDDRVLLLGTEAADYAEELLAVTARLPESYFSSATALAMGRARRLQHRLESILAANRDRSPLGRRRAAAVSIAGGMLACLAATFQGTAPVTVSADEALPTQVASLPQPAPQVSPLQISWLNQAGSERDSALQTQVATAETGTAAIADAQPKGAEPAAAEQKPAVNPPAPAAPLTIEQARDLIRQKFPGGANERSLDEGAIRGMLQSLNDPYSEFLPANRLKEFYRAIEGKVSGIGVEIALKEKSLVVQGVLPGAPAFRSGLRSGDEILSVDGKPIADLGAIESVVNVIRGPAGSEVRLRIRRQGDELDLVVTRGEVVITPVKGLWMNAEGKWEHWLTGKGGIAYVQLAEFSKPSSEQMKSVLGKLVEDNMQGLVLDLRGCPGGLFMEMLAVANLFQSEGVVVEVHGQGQEVFQYRADGKSTLPVFPLIVLIDDTTASAAEVLAASLQDRGRGTLLGTRTFGKGSIQTIFPLGEEGAMRLTSAWLHTSQRRSLNRVPGADDWGVSADDGFFVPMSASERAAWQRQKPARENPRAASQDGPALVAEFVRADRQLEAALRAFVKRGKDGEFPKEGGSTKELREYYARGEALRREREELVKKLQQVDEQLSSVGGTSGK